MTSFAIDIENSKQAEALFAFLKTLDSVKITKTTISHKSNKKKSALNDEMKKELDNRINDIGKVKTFKASETLAYARKRIKSRS